jgi:glycerol-3-phosphate dehydrogenase
VKRDLGALEAREHDVVVVGGGIFGACIAWDAALRGLDVALVERDDFGHATSANSFKMVHGGIRYLQHGDIARVRESSRERRALLRIAPHLVEPLPIVIPTYGHGMKGKQVLAAGMWLYDLLTADRNRGIGDRSRKIPGGRTLSRARTLEMFPSLPAEGLTGGALFHDAQMYNPTRLVLAFVKGAAERGAAVANYCEAESLIRDGRRVVGVQVRDRLSDESVEVRGRMVVNAAGPWAPDLIPENAGPPAPTFSRDACFVVPRRLTGPHALAVLGRTHDPDALLSRQARHLFLVPWRDSTLVGVWHVVHEGDADSFEVRREELEAFVDEVNGAYPAAELSVDEVSVANAGLVLFGDHQSSEEHLSYGKRSLVIDHAVTADVEGLLTVIGVRYTTARGVAERAVDGVEARIRGRTTQAATASTPLPGGDIDGMEAFTEGAIDRLGEELDRETVIRLVRNYGTEIDRVAGANGGRIGGTPYLRGEVLHAVRNEMACTLSDVVFRRTDLATAGPPSREVLAEVAELTATELGWSRERTDREAALVMERFDLPARPLSTALADSQRPG